MYTEASHKESEFELEESKKVVDNEGSGEGIDRHRVIRKFKVREFPEKTDGNGTTMELETSPN